MQKTYIIGKNFFPGIVNDETIFFIKYRKKKYHNLFKKILWYIVRTCRAYSNLHTCNIGTRILFDKEFVDKIREITPQDKVLIWDIPSIKTNIMLHQELPTTNIMTFLWNPICSLYQSKFSLWKFLHYKEKFHFIFSTFDPYDARTHNMRLLPQVYDLTQYACKEEKNSRIMYDVCFLAALKDKNREKEINDAYTKLKDENIKTFFYLFHPNKNIQIPQPLTKYLYNEKLSYQTYLDYILCSKCILEIVQPGQEGMSLRPLEALILKKKLITNNVYMINEDIYHPDNVYILNYSNKYTSIKEFLDVPYAQIPNNIINRHNIHTWMRDNILSVQFE